MKTVPATCPRCKGAGTLPPPDADDFALEEPCDLCEGETWIEVEIESEPTD